jgi:hypothetical protein
MTEKTAEGWLKLSLIYHASAAGKKREEDLVERGRVVWV